MKKNEVMENKLRTSDLVEGVNNLFTMLDELEDENEITDRLWKALEDTHHSLEDKFQAWASYLQYQEGLINIRKEEIKRLQQKNKAEENKIKNAKNQMYFYLKQLEVKKLETPLYNFNIQKSKASVIIEDDKKIPEQYKKVETIEKIDKQEIYKDLKEGKEIEGVSLKENESLRIR